MSDRNLTSNRKLKQGLDPQSGTARVFLSIFVFCSVTSGTSEEALGLGLVRKLNLFTTPCVSRETGLKSPGHTQAPLEEPSGTEPLCERLPFPLDGAPHSRAPGTLKVSVSISDNSPVPQPTSLTQNRGSTDFISGRNTWAFISI